MLIAFQPPALREGQSHRGPDYYMSSESGHAPVIYRSKDGCKSYIVCHDEDLPEAIERNEENKNRAVTSKTGRPIYFYTQREAAESRYRTMCQSQVRVNHLLHQRRINASRNQVVQNNIVKSFGSPASR